jgi:ferrous iron transport protein B
MIIAFIGQPNCGKSTIFNYFSGYKAVISNFPGTTVKYNVSRVVLAGEELTCVDLPGVYSLTSSDQAELESRNYLLKEEAEVIVNVIDASLLSRSLELTLELMSLERPMVVALNMMDEAARKGINIQPTKLSHLLGVPVVATVASQGKGLTELLETAVEAGRVQVRPAQVNSYGSPGASLSSSSWRTIPIFWKRWDAGTPISCPLSKIIRSSSPRATAVRRRP